MRELRPWNAFGTGARTDGPPVAARPRWTVVSAPLAPLHRRVPGATLDALHGTGPSHLAPMATSSADRRPGTVLPHLNTVSRGRCAT
jgi:hypothetical protein